MDTSKIINQQAKAFIDQFLRDREINEEFYKRVPEDKFDFRMVDTPQRKSDSPRESFAHQRILAIQIEEYIYAVPYVIDPKRKVVFLKTLYPSRVLTDKYTKGGVKDENGT